MLPGLIETQKHAQIKRHSSRLMAVALPLAIIVTILLQFSTLASPPNFVTLGTAALQKGDTATASNDFIQTLLTHPQDVPALQGLLSAYLQAHDIRNAAPVAQQLLELAPEDATTLTLLGELFDAKNNPTRALDYYQQAQKADPRPNPELTYALAHVQSQLGNTQEALENYAKVLLRWSQRGDIWQEYAQTLDQAGRQTEAIGAYQHAYALKPDVILPFLGAAQAAIWQQHLTEALPQLDKVAQITQDTPDSLALLAAIHYRLWSTAVAADSPSQIANLAERIDHARKKDDTPALQLAVLQLALVQANGWTPTLQQTIQTWLALPHLGVYTRAMLLTMQGDILNAKQQWESLAGSPLTPNQAQRATLTGAGFILPREGLDGPSQAGLNQWVSIDEPLVAQAISQADLLIAANMLTQAQKILLTAHHLNPFSPSVPLRLAQIALKQGDKDHARQFLAVAQKLGPEGPEQQTTANLTDEINGVAKKPPKSPSKGRWYLLGH